jgi:hypothetical protein
MKVSVSELQGDMLDFWVSRVVVPQSYPPANPYSRSWEYTGPLIETHHISLQHYATWEAVCRGKEAKGSTALEAVCRAFVLANFGDEVEVE